MPAKPKGFPTAPLDQVATPVYTEDPSLSLQLLGILILEVTLICPGEPCPFFVPDQIAMSVCSTELPPYP